ncbi:hypothetical protein PsYK624_114570 [Phanerochaete sordida]|uniref:Protein LCHN n=1 Tax=Phanerochaete sordida TaxID=48140 RepID=A0A9P3LI39_9APHY|nr:hypothetical protein PsYK624_114570 [Phanerochaete sordida]
MSTSEARQRPPQDVVAIFHASFHPTQGNVLDWSLKTSDDFDLSNVEFSCLPSGLHLIEEDVVYFTKASHQGVCIFRRRPTTDQGHRGFRLSSLGILLAKSTRSRPWKHVSDLKRVLHTIYQRMDDRSAASGSTLEPLDSDWEPARAFFEERQVRTADLGGAGDWRGWDAEMPGSSGDYSPYETAPPTPSAASTRLSTSSAQDSDLQMTPTLHLPHLLRALGPSSLTLYKHILGRRRVLIYTAPPVEPACVLCQVAADMCFEAQTTPSFNLDEPSAFGFTSAAKGKLKDKACAGVKVLGVVTLHDLDRLKAESMDGRGWVACTTDAIFLEKPEYYDLLVDLTVTPIRGGRPAMASPKTSSSDSSPFGREKYKLSAVRFTWSDVKLWTELDRLVQLSLDESEAPLSAFTVSPSTFYPTNKSQSKLSTITSSWSDVWRVYEDVCVICAGLWMGTWRSASPWRDREGSRAENWGSIRLNGDDTLAGPSGGDDSDSRSTKSRVYVRNVGMGIEGRSSPPSPIVQEDGMLLHRTKSTRRTSGSSLWTWASARGTLGGTNISLASKARKASADDDTLDDADAPSRRARQVATTLALLQTFQANTDSLLARLAELLPERAAHSHQLASGAGSSSSAPALVLTPKDLQSFDLGPLSGLDGRFVEWLVEVYGGGARVVVRRGWRDVMAFLLGLG